MCPDLSVLYAVVAKSSTLLLGDRDELQHDKAVQLVNGASSGLLTHSYVLAELVALALVRRFPRMGVLAFVVDLVDNPDIETVWVGEQLHREAIQLLGMRIK
jgi:hypothetical protein